MTIHGDVSFEGSLHLEGCIQGLVTAEAGSKALFTVAPGGTVQGKVRVPVAVVDGTVEGDIHCSERLELTAGARIVGDVYYKLLQMAAGARVEGRMVHESGDPARLEHLVETDGAEPDEADAQAETVTS